MIQKNVQAVRAGARYTVLSVTAVVTCTIALGCSGAEGGASGVDETAQTVEALSGSGPHLAVFRPSNQTWYYDTNDDGTYGGADASGSFGLTGDIALSGYGSGYCGHGYGVIATWRPSTRQFLIDSNGNGVWDNGVDKVISNFAAPSSNTTDTPILFSVVTGGAEFPKCKTVIGYFRAPTSGTGPAFWLLDLNDDGIFNDGTNGLRQWGQGGDKPVPHAGVRGASMLAVVRPVSGSLMWIEDTDGNQTWGGCNPGPDRCYTFGNSTDLPIAHPSYRTIGTSRNSEKFFDLNNDGQWNAGDLYYPLFGLGTDQAVLTGGAL